MAFALIHLFVDSLLLLYCLVSSLITKWQVWGKVVKQPVVRVVLCLKKDILSGQKQQATHAISIQWRLIERIQANSRQIKCSKDIQASLEMENYHQLSFPYVSHNGVPCFSLSAPLLHVPSSSSWDLLSQGPAQAPSSNLHECSPEPTTIELIPSLSINSKYWEERLWLGSSAWLSFQLPSLALSPPA